MRQGCATGTLQQQAECSERVCGPVREHTASGVPTLEQKEPLV